MDNLDILFLRLGQKNILGHRDPKYMLTVTLHKQRFLKNYRIWVINPNFGKKLGSTNKLRVGRGEACLLRSLMYVYKVSVWDPPSRFWTEPWIHLKFLTLIDMVEVALSSKFQLPSSSGTWFNRRSKRAFFASVWYTALAPIRAKSNFTRLSLSFQIWLYNVLGWPQVWWGDFFIAGGKPPDPH